MAQTSADSILKQTSRGTVSISYYSADQPNQGFLTWGLWIP